MTSWGEEGCWISLGNGGRALWGGVTSVTIYDERSMLTFLPTLEATGKRVASQPMAASLPCCCVGLSWGWGDWGLHLVMEHLFRGDTKACCLGQSYGEGGTFRGLSCHCDTFTAHAKNSMKNQQELDSGMRRPNPSLLISLSSWFILK